MQQDIIKVNDKTINSIQALRGIAAILVVLFHYRMSFNLPFYNFGNEILISGAVGVPLFFTISGFIMAYTQTRHGPLNAIKFLINRACRIIPLYYICTFAWIAILNLNLTDTTNVNNIGNLIKSLLFIPLANGPAPGFGYSTLFVGWSLNYEMFFYAIFAISLVFGRFRWACFFSLLAFILIAMPSIVGTPSLSSEVSYGFDSAYIAMATNPIMWNFVAGVIIALIVKNIQFKWLSSYAMPFAWICVVLFSWQYVSGFNAGVSINQWGIFSCLLLFSVIIYERFNGFYAFKPLVFLGEISFSIYLLHPIVKEINYALLFRSGHENLTSGVSFGVLCIASTIIISYITKNLIEVKVSNHIKNAISKNIFK